jgi:tetratricopeptide (TPR) repeat protein
VLVPLVVRYRGRVMPAEIRAPARLVDVAPTVLDLLGLPPLAAEGGVDGRSLVPLLAGGDGALAPDPRPHDVQPDLPPAYLETRQPWTSYGWAPLAAVRDARFKLISAPRPELYDLAADPGETRNLWASTAADRPAPAGEEAERAARRLRAALREVEARPAASAGVAEDPETLARLAALGYVGAGAAAGEPPPGLPDPKDRIALREALTEADDLLRRGRAAEALARFERVLATEPGNRFALVRSGIALGRLGRGGEATVRLRRAVAADPAQAETRTALADALLRAGRPAEAADEWAEVVRLQPRRASSWGSLGVALGRAGRPSDAVAAMARAVELEPGSPDRLVRLAFAEHAAGRVADAAAHLEAAAALAPDRFAHAGALGLLLADLGRPAEARPWLAASRPAEPEHAAARYRLAEIAAAGGDEPAARRALAEALTADPRLRPSAAADPRLAPLLAGGS